MRKIAAIITTITGDRVIVSDSELRDHARKHFPNVPIDMLLELLERVLKDPDIVFFDEEKGQHLLFYKIDEKKYIVSIVKKTRDGTYFSSMYPTGPKIRNKHKSLKRVKI